LFGFAGWGIGTDASGITSAYNENYTYWADFIFQAMFAATAVTIVSGAVAERVRIQPFMVFAFLYLVFCYPIVGMWKWGGGFLDTMQTPFYDFAGSTLVHGVGGWAALMGCIVLGPRLGKYYGDEVNTLQPSSLPLATVGVFLLWFGWYGFNGGSVLSADPGAISYVFVTTSLGGAAGIMGAMLGTVVLIKHLDLAMVLNGALAGLVGVTAGADQLGVLDAVAVGLIAGFLVVAAVLFFDR
jgi:Amt family ammonium transporter